MALSSPSFTLIDLAAGFGAPFEIVVNDFDLVLTCDGAGRLEFTRGSGGGLLVAQTDQALARPDLAWGLVQAFFQSCANEAARRARQFRDAGQ